MRFAQNLFSSTPTDVLRPPALTHASNPYNVRKYTHTYILVLYPGLGNPQSLLEVQCPCRRFRHRTT